MWRGEEQLLFFEGRTMFSDKNIPLYIILFLIGAVVALSIAYNHISKENAELKNQLSSDKDTVVVQGDIDTVTNYETTYVYIPATPAAHDDSSGASSVAGHKDSTPVVDSSKTYAVSGRHTKKQGDVTVHTFCRAEFPSGKMFFNTDINIIQRNWKRTIFFGGDQENLDIGLALTRRGVGGYLMPSIYKLEKLRLRSAGLAFTF